jgi:hypothetical protein
MAESPGTVPEVPAATAVFEWGAGTVFSMLDDPRRGILLGMLASRIVRPVSKLVGSVGRRLDITPKHLKALCDSGLIIAQHHLQDGHRQVYSPSPNLMMLLNAATKSIRLEHSMCSKMDADNERVTGRSIHV